MKKILLGAGFLLLLPGCTEHRVVLVDGVYYKRPIEPDTEIVARIREEVQSVRAWHERRYRKMKGYAE